MSEWIELEILYVADRTQTNCWFGEIHLSIEEYKWMTLFHISSWYRYLSCLLASWQVMCFLIVSCFWLHYFRLLHYFVVVTVSVLVACFVFSLFWYVILSSWGSFGNTLLAGVEAHASQGVFVVKKWHIKWLNNFFGHPWPNRLL